MTAEQHQLAAALQLSKVGSGRQQLVTSGELNVLAGTVAAHVPLRGISCEIKDTLSSANAQQLLVLLRVLRNSCAAGAVAAQILQTNRVHEIVAQLAASLAKQNGIGVDKEQQTEETALLLAAMQLLANMSVASEDAARAVWEQLYPETLQIILTVLQGSVHEVVALVALNCARANSRALADLTSPNTAGTIWLQLLTPVLDASTAPTSTSSSNTPQQQQQLSVPGIADCAAPTFCTTGNDNLCLLVKAVALQYDCMHKLMQCLQIDAEDKQGASSTAAAVCSNSSRSSTASRGSCSRSQPATGLPGFQPNMAHAVLLHIVQLEVEAIPAASSISTARDEAGRGASQQQVQQGTEQQLAAPAWVQYLVCLLHEVSGQVSRREHSRNTSAAHVLEATLQVLKAVVAREDAGKGLLQYAAAAAAAQGASCCSATDCVMQLHSLGLTQQLIHMLRQLGVPLKATQQAQQQQQPQPYGGYRADLVAILSNMVHDRHSIQDDVMAAGGIEVLLNNCNLDDTAPLAREWALWSIRNMCKDNKAVQQYIAKFKAVDAIQSEELDSMGKELLLDKMTSKLTLVDKVKQRQQRQS